MSKNPINQSNEKKESTTNVVYFVKNTAGKLIPVKMTLNGKFSEDEVEEYLKNECLNNSTEITKFHSIFDIN